MFFKLLVWAAATLATVMFFAVFLANVQQ